MAQQTTVRFVDDLDGTDATGTFKFGIDKKELEIDLSAENVEKLRSVLKPYIDGARRAGTKPVVFTRTVTGSSSPSPKMTAPSATAPKESVEPAAATAGSATDIRSWAAANGIECAPKGRIPRRVTEAYKLAHTVVPDAPVQKASSKSSKADEEAAVREWAVAQKIVLDPDKPVPGYVLEKYAGRLLQTRKGIKSGDGKNAPGKPKGKNGTPLQSAELTTQYVADPAAAELAAMGDATPLALKLVPPFQEANTDDDGVVQADHVVDVSDTAVLTWWTAQGKTKPRGGKPTKAIRAMYRAAMTG